jgi:hypothetical protein
MILNSLQNICLDKKKKAELFITINLGKNQVHDVRFFLK